MFSATMRPLRQILTAVKAAHQLGLRPIGLYAWYQTKLCSGLLRRQTQGPPRPSGQAGRLAEPALDLAACLALPDRTRLAALLPPEAQEGLVAEAGEIASGQVRLFGGEPVPLQLAWPGPLQHWTEYEKRTGLWQALLTACPVAGFPAEAAADIKYIWEPARCGWAFTLARAYYLSREESLAAAFWRLFEDFTEANPPYLGPNWVSAQEVALRLLAFTFAGQVLAGSSESTPARRARLVCSVAAHAVRIPPTLAYARSQHNNHLLVEAAGLITAGLYLPDHPSARRWLKLGVRWFNAGLQTQIAADGSYAQHSTNYHRLLLHCALWVHALSGRQAGDLLSPASRHRLAAATRWLLALTDPQTGRVPNLGPNDGACILPLSSSPFEDHRPTLQAAGLAFLGERSFPPASHDELALWLSADAPIQPGAAPPAARPVAPASGLPSPARLAGRHSWAYLRVAHFTSRPGHADQLHLDLWWRGLNLAQDAGTFSYSAPPPWENALSGTAVHNTLTVAGRDQMSRAGRFLWLDWAQGSIIEHAADPTTSAQRLVAQHDGYRRLGILHRRCLIAGPSDGWTIEDLLLPQGRPVGLPVALRLHWLLPDWPWELEAPANAPATLRLASPFGEIRLSVFASTDTAITSPDPQLCRAGLLLAGGGPVLPTWGWVAPTYGQKLPALSFAVSSTVTRLPAGLTSVWQLPD